MRTLKDVIVLVAFLGAATTILAENYDLLGRRGSKMNSPMVYKDVNYKTIAKSDLGEKHALARQGLTSSATAIAGIYSDRKFGFSGYQYDLYTKNGKTSSRMDGYKDYFNQVNKYFTPVYFSLKADDSKLKTVPLTNTSYTVKFLDLTGNTTIQNYQSLYGKFDRDDQYYTDNDQVNDKFGLFYSADAEFTQVSPNDESSYISLASCDESSKKPTPYNEHAVSVAKFQMQLLSEHTFPYAHNTLCTSDYPSSPEKEKPQLYMGLHIRKANSLGGGKKVTTYTSRAKKLDNYIYNNHTIDVVAAGDFEDYMTEEAYAANAITVGIVRSGYAWKNAPYGAAKPEIANYENFVLNYVGVGPFIPYYPKKYGNKDPYAPVHVVGTQGAAVLTTAWVSDLISAYPFYRWHPEVVKAVLLTTNHGVVSGDGDSDPQIPSYNRLMDRYHNSYKCDEMFSRQSRFWSGNWTDVSEDYDGTRQIRFTIPVEKGNTYTAAIAWLSSGDDIARLNTVPQDFDLSVFDFSGAKLVTSNGVEDYTTDFVPSRNNFIASSASSDNPFEIVKFKAASDTYVTYQIVLHSDKSSSAYKGKVKLGFNVMVQRANFDCWVSI